MTAPTNDPTKLGAIDLLAYNLTLVRTAHGTPSLRAFSIICGVPQTTLERILDRSRPATLATVQKIAETLHMEAWQLLHPQVGMMSPTVRQLLFESSLGEHTRKLIREELDRIKPPSAYSPQTQAPAPRVEEPNPKPYKAKRKKPPTNKI